MKKDQYQGLTSEEAALKIGNLYDMVLIAAARSREIRKKKINTFGRRETMFALTEIEKGEIGKGYLREQMKAK